MKRKIVQHGSSSLTVSIPYKWIQKYNLNKGDEINIEENGNSLILSSDNRKVQNVKKIKVDDYFFKRFNT